MSILELQYWNEPILSKVAVPVVDFDVAGILGPQMLETMKHYDGLGLAAPQVGLLLRLFVMSFPETGREPLIVANPTLELSGDLGYAQEGCLSLPGIYEQVARPNNTVLHFFHVDGREDELELFGLEARIAQHEADHLDGVMFFDRRRMSKQVAKSVERAWDKVRHKYVKGV